jgi:hypothetical protein
MKKSYLLKIIKEEITNAIAEDANADKAARDAQKVAIQKQMVALQKKLADLAKGGNMNENELEEDQLNEMAKIAGDLEAAIKRVIDDNPETEGLALKKLIRADEDVLDALEGDDLYDNQLNRFISLYKGERTLSPRGRKGAERVETLGNKVDKMSPEDQAKIEAFIATLGGEDQLNEMAKISGKLESAIRKVIVNNHELEGLALKKKIKADDAVIDALAGDDLYDNQLNKFIALTRGERTLAQRGRKPTETPTPKPTPKSPTPKPQPKPEDKAEEKAKEGAGSKFADKGDKYGELKKKLAGVVSDMKDTAADYRKAEGAKKTELTKKLKTLSASKETIEKEMASLKKI